MGDYNPHAPYILGQEFVPIQDSPVVLDINQQYAEYGYSFSIDTPVALDMASFFMPRNAQVPGLFASVFNNMYIQVNIYPKTGPFRLGPVRTVLVPCSAISTSGPGMTVIGNGVRVTHQNTSSTRTASLFFDFSTYQFLHDKRILNVDFIYKGSVGDQDAQGRPVTFTNPDLLISSGLTSLVYEGTTPPLNFSSGYVGANRYSQTGALILSTSVSNSAAASDFGGNEVQKFSLGGTYPNQVFGSDPLFPVFPWTYSDLLRLQSTLTSGRDSLNINFRLPTTNSPDQTNYPHVTISTPALLVTYCEETRVAQGTGLFVAIAGTNLIRMSSVPGFLRNTILQPGSYWATITSLSFGDRDYGLGGQATPPIAAQRSLTELPSHESIKISYPNISTDVTVIDSNEPTVSTGTRILPQISFHASGSTSIIPLSAQSFSHVYGLQAPGQVYGNFTMTQDMYDAPIGALADWPFIRFYARRFGQTTVPLTVSIGASTCSITPQEFDALDKLTTDKWREVTLELDPPVPMGTGSIPQVIWSATGERAGNRWEVLGATAPAVTGILSTYTDMLGAATYGAPPSGSVIDMTWLPQYGPMVSGMTPSKPSDVSVIFSQQPPPVTGLTATWLSQAVTGIGQNCDINPCCIPSEIYYLQLTWNQPADEELLLDDSFDRTEPGVWGTPDTGPPWDDVFTGGTPSVAGGLGIHTITTDTGYVTEQAGSLSITNSRLLARSVQPSATPVGGFVRAILFGRETGSFTYSINVDVDFLADGTAEVSISELGGPASEGPVAIPGVTASDAVDVMVDLIGNNVLVRVALSSEGVGPGTPPILWTTVTSASAGHIGVETHTETGVTVPIDMQYGHITIYEMAATASVPVSFKDTFDRNETGTWGAPYYGPEYVALNSSAALSVVNNEGLIEHTTMGADPEGAVIPLATANFDITAMLRNESGGTIRAGVMGRYIVDNFYEAYVEVSSATAVYLVLSKTVAGVSTELARFNITSVSGITTGIGSATMVRFMVNESNLKVKVWAPGSTEPLMWLIEHIDSDITTDVGYMAFFIETLSASSATLAVSNVEITPPQYWFGSYELQRRDTVEDEWQTIMKATNPAVTTFNDFEARPGIVSEYRIRTSNVYDFHGEWSPAVSGMIPAPGIYGGCVSDGHILIFTTNEHQSGTSNLAYASIWLDQQVEENFSFPEAGFVQMQAMYDRDFYVAFRPLERGGEQFQRTVLVQAAAIAPETLADFTNLRNLAWADVNYVCVRDEDGNRWFAHIGVPSGNVLRNRKLYLAPVQITEVSATPTPVDPSPWF